MTFILIGIKTITNRPYNSAIKMCTAVGLLQTFNIYDPFDV